MVQLPWPTTHAEAVPGTGLGWGVPHGRQAAFGFGEWPHTDPLGFTATESDREAPALRRGNGGGSGGLVGAPHRACALPRGLRPPPLRPPPPTTPPRCRRGGPPPNRARSGRQGLHRDHGDGHGAPAVGYAAVGPAPGRGEGDPQRAPDARRAARGHRAGRRGVGRLRVWPRAVLCGRGRRDGHSPVAAVPRSGGAWEPEVRVVVARGVEDECRKFCDFEQKQR